MTRFYKRLLGVSLAITLLLICTPPGQVAAQEQPKGDAYETEVIARVDGIPISRLEFLNTVSDLVPAKAYHTSIPEKLYEQVQEEAMDKLILNILIYKEVKAQDLYKIDPTDIDAQVEEMRKTVPKGDTLEQLLEKNNMTVEDLKEKMKKSVVIHRRVTEKKKAFKKKASDTVTEDFLKNYYERNLAIFAIPEKILLRNILIKVASASSQRVWNDARKKAIELLKRARAGEDFAELARQNSEGPKAAEGGDMGWAQKGSLTEEFDFAASVMKKGEISDPIMSIYGYYLIKLEDITPIAILEFAKIDKPKLKEQLEERVSGHLMRKWEEELRSNAKIERLTEDLY